MSLESRQGVPVETPAERMRRQAQEVVMTLKDPSTGEDFMSAADAEKYAADLIKAADAMDGKGVEKRTAGIPVEDIKDLPIDEQDMHRNMSGSGFKN